MLSIGDRVRCKAVEILDKYPTVEYALKNIKHEKFTNTEEKRLVIEDLKAFAENDAVFFSPRKLKSGKVKLSAESGTLLGHFLKLKAEYEKDV